MNSSSPLVLVPADLLVGPDHLLERERDLLPRLELDDVGNPLLLDRRQLDELDQARLTRHGDGNLAALQVVAFEKRLERLAHQLLGVGVGLAEDLGVLDEVERLGHDLVGGFARNQLQRLQRGLADIERPDGLDLRHAVSLLSIDRLGRRTNAKPLRLESDRLVKSGRVKAFRSRPGWVQGSTARSPCCP